MKSECWVLLAHSHIHTRYVHKYIHIYNIQLLDGYEENTKYIVSRGNNYLASNGEE
jgi:hypothetical protein